MRRAGTVLFSVLILVALAPVPAIAAASGCGRGQDFNGDGRADLAVGVPGEDIGAPDTGAVNVMYGSAAGLTTANSQFWHEDSPGIADTPELSAQFGWALASGDFDGDGRDDLAVGVPFKTVNGLSGAGRVHILYGSAAGLSASGDQIFDRNTSGVADEEGADDRFGRSLAACDFDGDGRDDLAVGVPDDDVEGNNGAGSVHVLYGSATGLTASGDQILHQNTPGMTDTAESGEEFGLDLAAGDFDGDGRGDLVAGVLDELVGPVCCIPEGAVHVIYGSATGLTASGDQLWHQNSSGIADEAEPGDGFGGAVDSGDFDADGRDDLAVGVPFQDVNGQDSAGAVHVIYGSSTGLSASGDQVFHQDTSGMADAADEFENFGRAVSSGDFDGDGFDDLGIGVPFQTVNDKADAGAVHILYGSTSGLTTSGDQVFHQDTAGIADSAESECPILCFFVFADSFGLTLTAGDFDDDGREDLVAGIAHEDLVDAEGSSDEGAAHVIYGSAAGLSASGDQFIHQGISGLANDPAPGESFGGGLVDTQHIPLFGP